MEAVFLKLYSTICQKSRIISTLDTGLNRYGGNDMDKLSARLYLSWCGAEAFGLGLYNIGEVLEAIGGHNVIKLVSNNVMHEASLFLV